MKRPLLVGLTGGIASGKSTAARMFGELGIQVIDADAIAREVVQPGEPALEEIRARFGDGVLTPEGALDRAALRERVFRQPEDRRALEALLHPRIRERMFERALAVEHDWCILEIPLLVEGGLHAHLDRVIVVDVPTELQRERLAARDGVTETQIDQMLAAQVTREQRLAVADHVLENSGPLSELRAQVEAVARKLSASAKR